jgi:hypothetical protein
VVVSDWNLIASEGSLFVMGTDFHMLHQLGFLGKGSGALGTVEGFLSCVSPEMVD